MDTAPTSNTPRGRRPRQLGSQRMFWSSILVVAALAITAGVLVVFLNLHRGEVPKFPALADQPDATLEGTVAYVGAGDCIHVAALSGASDKQLYCLPKWDATEAEKLGKPLPPQLIWLSDGRLQVTVFRMLKGPGPGVNPGWQKIIDVKTGVVTETPASQVPKSPDLTTRMRTSPSGEVVSFTSNRDTGHVTISITDAKGIERKVLDERGPNLQRYWLTSAFWSPDYKWIIADDGRILVVSPGGTPLTRVLADVGGGNPFGDENPDHSGFAVTNQVLLPAG